MMRKLRCFPVLVLLALAYIQLNAATLFDDHFQRPDGDVAEGWTEIGSDVASIDGGHMLITASNGSGVYRDFILENSDTYCVQFSFQIETINSSFQFNSVDSITYFLITDTGHIYYDNNENFISPVDFGTVSFNQWHTFRVNVDLEADTFSVLLDDVFLLNDIAGNNVESFTQWMFMSPASGSMSVLIDDFFLGNGSLNDMYFGPMVLDNQDPTIDLVSPNGGEQWWENESQEIVWSANDSNLGDTPVSLEWSQDNGNAYAHLTDTENNGTWTWIIPLIQTSEGIVKAIVTDTFGNMAEDKSNGTFEIGCILPSTPQNVVLNLSDGHNAVLSWDAVTTNTNGSPVTPDYYIIRYSYDKQDEYFLGISPDSTFVHENALEISDCTFYRIAAWVDNENRIPALLELLKPSAGNVPTMNASSLRKNIENDYYYPILTKRQITWEELLKTLDQNRTRKGGKK